MIVFEDAYLTENQRQVNANFLEFDATMRKYSTLYEAVEGEFDANLALAEAKIFRECGTEDDLVALYEAAADEAEEKKKNIIARGFEAIAKFLKGIIDKFKKAFASHKNDNIEVDAKTAKTIEYANGEGKGHLTKLTNALNSLSTGGKIAAAVIPAIAITAFITKFKDLKSDEGAKKVSATDGDKAATLLGKLQNAIAKCGAAIGGKVKQGQDNDDHRGFTYDEVYGPYKPRKNDKNDSPEYLQKLISGIANTIGNAIVKITDAMTNSVVDSVNKNLGKESAFDGFFDDADYTVESQDDYNACMNYLDTMIADL